MSRFFFITNGLLLLCLCWGLVEVCTSEAQAPPAPTDCMTQADLLAMTQQLHDVFQCDVYNQIDNLEKKLIDQVAVMMDLVLANLPTKPCPDS